MTKESIRQKFTDLAYTAFKAASNAFRMYPENKHTYADHSDYLNAEIDQVLDAVEEYREQRWVRVGDGLPDFTLHDKTTSDKVIILFDGFVTIGSLYKKYGDEENVWFTVDDTFDEQFRLPVTHWMPLPEPPKD